MIKWLLVGPGDIARSRVAPALIRAKDSRLVAICGRRGSPKTDALAKESGIELIFDDLDEALASSAADAVYIATPHHLHVEMCRKALAAGKHVFCEKPLGINADECRSLKADVDAHPELVTACSNYRLFSQQFLATQRLIAEGAIGELVGGWAHDEEPYYNPSHSPLLLSRGMSPINTFGFYLIDIARELFGVPDRIDAHFSRFGEVTPTDDIDNLENISLGFGAKQFHIMLNMTASAPLRHAYEFCGTEGRIIWPESPPHFNKPIFLAKGWQTTEVAESISTEKNWHLPMIEDFIAAIREGRPARCTLANAITTAEITERVIENAKIISFH